MKIKCFIFSFILQIYQTNNIQNIVKNNYSYDNPENHYDNFNVIPTYVLIILYYYFENEQIL